MTKDKEEELNIRLNNWFAENWEHFTSEVKKNIAWGQMGPYANDLCILMFEEFMNKPYKNKLQMLTDDKILHFLLYGASFQIRSGSSPFYKQFRQSRVGHVPQYFAENERVSRNEGYELDKSELDDYYQCAMEAIKEGNLGFYHAKLIELKFIKQMSYKSICDTYGLCIATVKKDLHEALDIVRKKCDYLD